MNKPCKSLFDRAIALLAQALERMSQDRRVHIPRRVLAHPAIQMSIAFKHLEVVARLPERVRERRVRPVSGLRTVDHILGTCNEEDGQVLEPLQILRRDERLVLVVRHEAVRALVHELIKSAHRDSAEELVHV